MAHSPDVDDWFDSYEHPAKDAMLRLREILLRDSRIEETIKWKSPTFTYKGNLASVNPRTKAHVSLMFHTGAAIPGQHPLLQGGGDTARYMTFDDAAAVDAASDDIMAVVDAWCSWRDAGT